MAILWDYLVVNSNANMPQQTLDPARVANRVAAYYTEGVGLLAKYPWPLDLPLNVKDSRNGLTRFLDTTWPWDIGVFNVLGATAKVLPTGSRFGLYHPAPRSDGPHPHTAEVWIAYARNILALGVTDLFFDAQAKNHPYDRFVVDCIRAERLAVHVEPYDETNPTCQECSPSNPGEGLELGVRRLWPSLSKYSDITALITDVAPTRDDTLAYFKRWASLGCNVAVNVKGWREKHGITAAELLGLMK